MQVNAYLQQKMGFTNTHRLQGGIIAYDQWVRIRRGLAVHDCFFHFIEPRLKLYIRVF